MSSPKFFVSHATVLAALRRWIGQALTARQRAHQRLELGAMSERELRDLGIGRSEVPEWSRRRGNAVGRGAASDAAVFSRGPRSHAPCAGGTPPAACA